VAAADREVQGAAVNEHYDGDGALIYKHACNLAEGILSKRLGSLYSPAGRGVGSKSRTRSAVVTRG
jgi:ATP-dependent DNA ligase